MLERYDPFRATVPLRQAIDRLFEETLDLMRPFGLLARFGGFDGGYFMPVNIYHTADELVCQFIIPGVRPEDIQVELTGDTLTVKAEIKHPAEGQQVDWVRCEWQPGVYSRTLTLPFPVQADRAEAKYEHGVLTLRLPKAEEVRPKHIRVQAVSA